MTLVPQWRAVLTRAWSVLLLYLVMAISGLEALVSFFGHAIPGPLWLRAGLIFGISAAGVYARIVLQPRLLRRPDLTSEGFDHATSDYWRDPKGKA